MFWAIEFVRNKATKEPFPQTMHVAKRVASKVLEVGYDISIYYGAGCADGWNEDVAILSPPYNITPVDVEEIVRRVIMVLNDVFRGIEVRVETSDGNQDWKCSS